jgi:hemoglobin
MDAIRGVVDTLMARVVVDGRINAFFRGVDLEQLKRLLADQICQAAGGPCRYTGRPMREAHRGLGLTDAHFAALVGDLGYALNRFAVPMREQDELVAVLGTLKPEIVGQ